MAALLVVAGSGFLLFVVQDRLIRREADGEGRFSGTNQNQIVAENGRESLDSPIADVKPESRLASPVIGYTDARTHEVALALKLMRESDDWQAVSEYLKALTDHPDARVRLESRELLGSELFRRGDFEGAASILSVAWEEMIASMNAGVGLGIGMGARGAIASKYAVTLELIGQRENARRVMLDTLRHTQSFSSESLDNAAISLSSSYNSDRSYQEAVAVLERRLQQDPRASSRVIQALAIRAAVPGVRLTESSREQLESIATKSASQPPTAQSVLVSAALAEQYSTLGLNQRVIEFRMHAAQLLIAGGSRLSFEVPEQEQDVFRDRLLRHQLSGLLGASSFGRSDATLFAYEQLIVMSATGEELSSWTKQRDEFLESLNR